MLSGGPLPVALPLAGPEAESACHWQFQCTQAASGSLSHGALPVARRVMGCRRSTASGNVRHAASVR